MVLFVTFPLQIKSTGSEVKLRKNLLGWAEQSHSARGKAVPSDEELCRGWRKPESCCIPKEAEMMGLCGFKHKVSACPSSLDGAQGRKASCTRAVSPACNIVGHMRVAALLRQSPSVKGKRGFDSLSAKLIEICQCFERLCFTWALTIPELAVPC